MSSVILPLLRDRDIGRVVTAYLLFTLSEYAVWIAVLLYAYSAGGVTEAGLVAIIQLVPAALCAPVLAVRADRGSPRSVMLAGYACQVVGLGVAAVAVDRGWSSVVVYAGAVLAAMAVTATRPAQAVVLPSLARTARELTAANVALSWVESIGIAASGVWVAAWLTAGLGQVLAAGVVVAAIAGWLVSTVPEPASVQDAEEGVAASVRTEITDGLDALATTPGARSLVSLLFLQQVVLGALDVLFVLVALAVLNRPEAWAGYLNSAFGIGSLCAVGVSFFLIDRRLPRPILVAALVVGAGLMAIPLAPRAAPTVLLLAAVGAARSIFDVSGRTLLQRTVSPDVLGRVFGMVEGSTMAGLAAGSILVPALNSIGGSSAALVGTGAILPAAAIICSRSLLRLDRESRVPVVEIALLRSVDPLSRLPAPVLEGLARSLWPIELEAGDVLIAEGEIGDAYYAIASGRLEVRKSGALRAELTRGDGVGEIALLRDVRRTATVVAAVPSLVYGLPRDAFLIALTGHLPSQRAATRIVSARTNATVGDLPPQS
jgi:MFS family permease